MNGHSEALVVAEACLNEMLAADGACSFELPTKRFEETYLDGFTREVF